MKKILEKKETILPIIALIVVIGLLVVFKTKNNDTASGSNNNSIINSNKVSQNKKYINENVDLLNYEIGYSTKYTDEEVPSITEIEIKNNGDKDITELTIMVEFYDDNKKVIFDNELKIISGVSDSIKAGYSWKMEDDKFYELTNLSDEVDINNSSAKISDVKLSTVKNTKVTEEEKYIEEYMEILSFDVKKYDSYLYGKVPGLGNLSIKNNGSKDLDSVVVTVYFQDENGNNIADNSIRVIGSFGTTNDLKANYSWKMEDNKFYELENLANEVDLNRHTIKITEIEFDD